MGGSFRALWRRVVWMVAGCCLMWQAGTAIGAGNLYVYTDAQGQAVLTDDLQQVPAEYRGRLRAVTNGEPPSAAAMTSAAQPPASRPLSTPGPLQEIIRAVAENVSPIQGLTPHQTAVVILAAGCGMALLLFMFLSSNPAVRLLAKCLLILVSLTAVYQLVVGGSSVPGTGAGSAPLASGQSKDNVMGQVRSKTEQSYRLQDERTTRQLDQAGQSAP